MHRIATALNVHVLDLMRYADTTRTDDPTPTLGRVFPSPATPAGELFHYTPEEAATYLPWTPDRLRIKARNCQLPHHRTDREITFTGGDIRAIAEMTAVEAESATAPPA